MKLSSSSFKNRGNIPSIHTCDGDNIPPHLKISDIPENAETLVLIMYDPDIPKEVKLRAGIEEWTHWIVFNIPQNVGEIPGGSVPEGAILGLNTSQKPQYEGPCPPDSEEHRYFFKLYALTTTLDLPQGSTRESIEKEMAEFIIEETELVGKYEKLKRVNGRLQKS